MAEPDTKKGTRRKRDALSPVQIYSKRIRRSSQNYYNSAIVNAVNNYNCNSDERRWYEDEVSENDSPQDESDETFELPTSRDAKRKGQRKVKKSIKARKRKSMEIEKEKKERIRAEEKKKNAKRKQVEAEEEQKKKLQRKTQKAILKQEGEEFKAKLNITKSYNELSSEKKDISLKACRAILKNVVEKVGGERKESKKYDCIQNLTFPGVRTTSDAIVEEIIKWYNKLLNDRSIESVKQRRFIMGIFSQVVGRSEVNKLFKDNGLTDYKAKYKWYNEAKMDADNFLDGGILVNYNKLNSMATQEDETKIAALVDFVFDIGRDLISFVSWGVKTIKISDPKDGLNLYYKIPRYSRKCTVLEIYKQYKEYVLQLNSQTRDNNDEGESLEQQNIRDLCISPSAGQKIIDTLTTRGTTSAEAVNYYDVCLVSEVLDKVKATLEHFRLWDNQTKLRLQQIKYFLKREYLFAHIDKANNDRICSHNAHWAFGKDRTKLDEEGIQQKICADCIEPFVFMKDMLRKILEKLERIQQDQINNPTDYEGSNEDDITSSTSQPANKNKKKKINVDRHMNLIKYFWGILEKRMQLYMAYQMRVMSQREKRDKYLAEMKEDTVIVCLDYKMKQYPAKREKTINENFGQTGMSWHGTMIYYVRETNGKRERKRYYLDHLSAFNQNQDSSHTLAIFESICHWLKTASEFKGIVKNVVVLSDNASNYTSNDIILGAYFIAKEHGLNLAGIIHTESQDGKSELDAHFAHSNIKMKLFLMRNNIDLDTPYRIYQGLTEGKGLYNSTIFYFHFENTPETPLTKMNELSIKSFNIAQSKEIVYDENGFTTYQYSFAETKKQHFDFVYDWNKWNDNIDSKYRPTTLEKNRQHPLFQNKRENIVRVLRNVDWWKILLDRVKILFQTFSITWTKIISFLKDNEAFRFHPEEVIDTLLNHPTLYDDPNNIHLLTDVSWLQQTCLLYGIVRKVLIMNSLKPAENKTEWSNLKDLLENARASFIKRCNTTNDDYNYNPYDPSTVENGEEEDHQGELPNTEISPEEERNDDETNYMNEEELRDRLFYYGDEDIAEPSSKAFIEKSPPNFDNMKALRFTNIKYAYTNYNENVNRVYSRSSIQTPTNSQSTEKRRNKTNIATEDQLQSYNQWHIVALRKLIESDTYKRLQEENKAARTVKLLHPLRQDQHECSDECRNQCEKSKHALQIVEDNFPRGWAVRDLKSPLGSNFVTHKQEGIWEGLREEVESLFKVGKEMQAAQMHDDLSSKVLCPWLTLPSCRELHNEISALAKKKAVEELDTEH